MNLTKKEYKKRLIDDIIAENLNIFGAISIEGPKWCGKTWTALNHANSVVYLNNTADDFKFKKLALMNVDLIMNGEFPLLIDEWQEVPTIWDAVRYKCDLDKVKGKFILTGSAVPVSDKIAHSGAGRIVKMKMFPMSLYESGYSTGDVSLKDLFSGIVTEKMLEKVELSTIAEHIVKGGWPDSINNNVDSARRITKSYLDAIIDSDISNIDGIKRDKRKMEMLLKSLARNVSANCTNTTLISDISDEGDDLNISRNTVADYLDVLDKLHITMNQNSFMYKIRSKSNVGKNPKRHFCDPSIGCAALNLTVDKLMNDLNTFGLYFESLVFRDLSIYASVIDAKIFHYRDNNTGVEIDSIIEFGDACYGAIEVKLGANMIEEAAITLNKFYEMASVKPKFMAIICGISLDAVVRRADGIYLFPITALKN